MPLKSVTVTKWNVSELVRLCLRKHDADDNASRSTYNNENDDGTDQEDEVVGVLYMYSQLQLIRHPQNSDFLRINRGAELRGSQ